MGPAQAPEQETGRRTAPQVTEREVMETMSHAVRSGLAGAMCLALALPILAQPSEDADRPAKHVPETTKPGSEGGDARPGSA